MAFHPVRRRRPISAASSTSGERCDEVEQPAATAFDTVTCTASESSCETPPPKDAGLKEGSPEAQLLYSTELRDRGAVQSDKGFLQGSQTEHGMCLPASGKVLSDVTGRAEASS